jgi:hypothetical protein
MVIPTRAAQVIMVILTRGLGCHGDSDTCCLGCHGDSDTCCLCCNCARCGHYRPTRAAAVSNHELCGV